MKQHTVNSISNIKRHGTYKAGSKYSRIIEAFAHYDIICEDSHAKVTVKFNNGGILYIEVEDKKIFK
jgi:hypothetical protein